MKPETVWGLPSNLDWLAEQGRVSSLSGVCSDNSGITAGNPCSESSQCECGRWLQTSTSETDAEEVILTLSQSDPSHRGLPKDDKKGGEGGGKQNPVPSRPLYQPHPLQPQPQSQISAVAFIRTRTHNESDLIPLIPDLSFLQVQWYM